MPFSSAAKQAGPAEKYPMVPMRQDISLWHTGFKHSIPIDWTSFVYMLHRSGLYIIQYIYCMDDDWIVVVRLGLGFHFYTEFYMKK